MWLETSYIWQNQEFVERKDSVEHTVSHAMHYWTAAFEGIRFYSTDEGPKIFRLDDHIERFIYSMWCLWLNFDYTKDYLIDVCKTTVEKNQVEAGYIRPIAWYWYGKMWLNPEGWNTNISVSVWPWWKYLSADAVDVMLSSFVRPHPESVYMNAKVSWYYINSFFANTEAKNYWYDEALLLDHEGNVAEGPGENIFFVKWNYIYTPSLWSILPWITRDTLIKVCKNDFGFEVLETQISPDQLSDFDEAFFVGTAAEVTPIWTIKTKNQEKITYDTKWWFEFADFYTNIVHWKIPKYKTWLF